MKATRTEATVGGYQSLVMTGDSSEVEHLWFYIELVPWRVSRNVPAQDLARSLVTPAFNDLLMRRTKPILITAPIPHPPVPQISYLALQWSLSTSRSHLMQDH